MDRKPRVLDLFCGAGGLSYGLHRSGFDVVGGVESNEIALKTYLANHPSARSIANAHDIRRLTPANVWDATGLAPGELDVVAGGPPCQGFSTAGYRKRADDRNALVFEFVRLIDELRPMYFLMENVVGLLSMRSGSGERVLAELRSAFAGIGYTTSIPGDESDWRRLVLNAADFGVPQRRRRVFVMGARDGLRVPSLPLPSHTDPNLLGFAGREQHHVNVIDALADLPAPQGDGRTLLPVEVELSEYARAMRRSAKYTYNHTPTRHKPWMIEKMRDQEVGTPLYDTWAHAWVRLKPDEPSPTVKENHNAPFVHFSEPRVVTPRECARLQSFPDSFRFYGPKSKQLVQIGNAVPPLLAQAIGNSLASAWEREVTGGSSLESEAGLAHSDNLSPIESTSRGT